jgi:pyruvate formate lyase activating enzyme
VLRRSPLLLALSFLLVAGLGVGPTGSGDRDRHEASYYEKLDRGNVHCLLCPRGCIIPPGSRGVCRVRENRDGTLYSVVYGRPCSMSLEPIEKAPFFHFLPGASRLCIATPGCNQSCKYCQNWEISQRAPEDLDFRDMPPESVVALAREIDTPIICFTFSEPIVFFEFMCDIARLARKAGIRTAVVTGGYINPEPLRELCGLVDAIKIDLKGFTDEFYREVCGSSLKPVLEACRVVAGSGTHLELVNLVVPALNDDSTDIRRMCQWIAWNLGDTVPIHFTRFGPAYRMSNSPPTPIPTLEQAAGIADRVGLEYVYVGNVPGHEREDTFCPQCDSTIIDRQAYTIVANKLDNGSCPFCATRISGVWE